MKTFRKITIITLLSIASLCLLSTVVSAINNLWLPQQTEVIDHLSEADKARLEELLHLRRSVGDQVWPGFGGADIPVIHYNEQYAFLVGYPDPPAGWIKVPAGIHRGGPWERVHDDTFQEASYYRQRLPDANITPEAFTVQVGERWAASMQTMDWLTISLRQTIQDDLPALLRPVFPYSLFIGQMVDGSDQYISLMTHEAFHAFQGMNAPEKFTAAEEANTTYESQYPWNDEAFQADWETELGLLASALREADQEKMAAFAQNFIRSREARRSKSRLQPELAMYEKQREWIEGLARYAELEIWQQADSKAYMPSKNATDLRDFKKYRGFEKRWSREVDQITMMADDHGDGRFYYSGMAQAYLLDRLMPDWKTRALEHNVWLEDLLFEAVGKQ